MATQAVKLVDLAHELFRVVIDKSGQPFAVPREGPQLARPLHGKGSSFAKTLGLAFFRREGKAATPTAASQALQVLEAEVADDPRVEVHLRCARTSGGLVLDLGDETGRVVVLRDGRWRVRDKPPKGILFRRSRMTAAMPVPSRRGDLEALRELVNVTDEGWDLVRAWLVSAWLPDPVPILSLTGPQGRGKSVAARTLVEVVDPATAPLRSMPKDLADWQTVAAASRVVALDNVSRIPDWLSDALCRAVTGEGAAKRMLYTDDELIVHNFRRAVVLTSIDPGSLKGDLGERLMPVELRALRGKRRSEATLAKAFRRRAPAILGGLLDLTAKALAHPVTPKQRPRMADAAKVMASVDRVAGSNALGAYLSGQARTEELVLESDPLAAAVLAFMRQHDERSWIGTPTELHAQLALFRPEGKNWPSNARTMSERLRRLETSLRRTRRLEVTWPRSMSERRVRLRWVGKRPRRDPNAPRVTAASVR